MGKMLFLALAYSLAPCITEALIVNQPLQRSSWYRREDHPVHTLFSRTVFNATFPNETAFPPVGSQQWTNLFNASLPDISQLPPAWIQALNSAVVTGSIPNISISTLTTGPDNSDGSGMPVYPNEQDPNSPKICSATYGCRGVGVIYDAPSGFFGSSFDDGPLPATSQLVQFLQLHNETTTHFMIGSNIYQNPQQFLAAYNAGHDIAVHTYTHPYMTTLTNEQVLAELGYTMLIIQASTGGKLPKYWRPPYGDADNRVVAIAKEVFGLETVIWNNDTNDWMLPDNTITTNQVQTNLNKWISGPKSPGLIILEHELANQTVQAFMNAYPSIKQNGWNFTSLARLFDDHLPYQNDVAPSPSASILPSSSSLLSASRPSVTLNLTALNTTPPAPGGTMKMFEPALLSLCLPVLTFQILSFLYDFP